MSNKRRPKNKKKPRKKKTTPQRPKNLWFSTKQHPDDPDLVKVHIIYPDGGKTPSRYYTGQDAADRIRRWCIGMGWGMMKSAGSAGPQPDQADPEWFYSPAFGRHEGVEWQQSSINGSCNIRAVVPRAEDTTFGTARTDGIARMSTRHFIASQLRRSTTLSIDEIRERLAQTANHQMSPALLACGFSMRFSYSSEDNLYIFSAQLRPVGRTPHDRDWTFISEVARAIGAPPDEDCALCSLLSPDQNRAGILKWIWRETLN